MIHGKIKIFTELTIPPMNKFVKRLAKKHKVSFYNSLSQLNKLKLIILKSSLITICDFDITQTTIYVQEFFIYK